MLIFVLACATESMGILCGLMQFSPSLAHISAPVQKNLVSRETWVLASE